jgi:2-methylthioadenine synthetase
MSETKQKFNIISLGCARNLVDSEVMAGLLHKNNFEMVREPELADIVLVNTCGFIGAAKEESIDTILDVARLKETGQIKKLVVAGCLSQRYPDELAAELPEVDLFIGTGEVPRIAEILREHEANTARRQFIGVPSYIYDHATPRLRSTPSYTAFLKVSEGCDHKCAFCIIPQMRGPHRSRSIDSVVERQPSSRKTASKRSISSRKISPLTVETEKTAPPSNVCCAEWKKYQGSSGFGFYTLILTFSIYRSSSSSATALKSASTWIFPFNTAANRSCSECAGAKAAAPFEKQ